MKYLPNIAGVLLGLAFAFAALAYFFAWVDAPPPAEGSPAALFFAAFYPTGYLDFVKALELIGAILVAIPLTRRLGLLVLGPIIVNILAFHVFMSSVQDLVNPMLILIVVITLYLVWVERLAFIAFLRGGQRSE